MHFKKIIVTAILIMSLSPDGFLQDTQGTDPYICLVPSIFNFGATGDQVPPNQTARINNRGLGSMPRSISVDAGWLTVTPTSGVNGGTITVSVDPTGLMTGTHHATIKVTAPNATNSPRTATVNLDVFPPGITEPPFGDFGTPEDGANVSGSIPVTGWALDDTGVESVDLYRNDLMGEVFMGKAKVEEGAFPDILTSYPSYPNSHKAGWGYMLLTNTLPNGGNGTYQISAIATDNEGNQTTLGTKTIHCDNANAVKPFGAIDTPTQGGTATGSQFINRGWVLTPQPNQIPTDGSTIDVLVDGTYVGHPIYNVYRADIAALFPDYANSNGAAAYFTFDTRAYANGIHTITWGVRNNTGQSDDIGKRYFIIQNNDGPTLSKSKSNMNFGANTAGPSPTSQTFQVNNTGTGTLNWTATKDADWLSVSPASGTNSGTVTVSVDPSGLAPGDYQGKVTVSGLDANNSPQTVTVNLNVHNPDNDTPPFGSFDTPVHNATVRSSISVTGWALDDSEVENVKIYNGSSYIGDAVFVEGARPDVEQACPGYPNNNKAGWGYMLLTNFLPNGGNGTYTLHAVATDNFGQSTTLGTKTIQCDNANAVKPFGAIDTPGQGDEVSGTVRNRGWVLASPPNTIPTDGIDVWVDGVNVGKATYNQYRADIATMFPSHNNSQGAGAHFDLDTTPYQDGVYTIYWTATDNEDQTDGIGSRYFRIKNDPPSSDTKIFTDRTEINAGAVKDGGTPPTQTVQISNSGAGTLNWSLSDDSDWLVATPSSGTNSGVVTVSVNPSGLNTGTYHGTLTVTDPSASNTPKTVVVRLNVYDSQEAMESFGAFETPADGSTVGSSVQVTGWALDDVGVGNVGIYNRTPMGDNPIGDAVFVEGTRPDIALQYPNYPNNNRAGWDYTLNTHFLPDGGNGTYQIAVIATDAEGKQTELGTKTIYCDNANAVKLFGAIDTPTQGSTVSGSSFVNRGWALTPQPKHIPTDGSTINVFVDGVNLGNPTYNVYRADIAAFFPDHANSNGAAAYFEVDLTGYADGVHTIYWTATDNEGQTDRIGSRSFNVDNSNMGTAKLKVDPQKINIGVSPSGSSTTSDQSLIIGNSGGGTLNWSITNDDDWLICTPSSGTGSGVVTVSVDPGTLPGGGLNTGTLIVSDPNAFYSPQFVPVVLNYPVQNYPPFGSLDTPVDGATVSGSIPVTGWALDDVEVVNVKIYNGSSYVGDAVFVEGARPDVEQTYPGYPNNHKAGWGYMLITNFLPGGGNGTYVLYARATDTEGQEVTLGTKTIQCDNANAVKPFGDISLPWGGTAYGTNYPIEGWALTPPPNSIPNDGSTIDVIVDGKNIGHPTYNIYRHDIASMFPGYDNSNGAGAIYYLDTTPYGDGIHTIQWSVTDDAGNTDGIGPRYVKVNNANPPTPPTAPKIVTNRSGLYFSSANGATTSGQTFRIENGGVGDLDWTANESDGWLTVTPKSGTNSGVVTVTVNPSGLGEDTYNGTLTITDDNASNSPQTIYVDLTVKNPSSDQPPFGDFATPANKATVSGSIAVTGWVLDDVEATHIDINHLTPMGPVHIGDAAFVEGARPDVEQAYPGYPMNYRAGWDYHLITNTLNGGNGTYILEAIARDGAGHEVNLGTKTILVDNSNAVKPFGAIDTPVQGGTASGGEYRNHGWVLTPKPNKIPTDGSTIRVYIDGVEVGHVQYNIYRQDISDLFPGYANSQGAMAYFDFNTTEYKNGLHTIQWIATDDAGNTDGIGSRFFSIQNIAGPSLSLNRHRLNFGSDPSGNASGRQPFLISNTGGGTLKWTVSSDQTWLTANPTSGTNAGIVVVTVDPSGLGVGMHTAKLTVSDPDASNAPQILEIFAHVHSIPTEVFGSFDSPVDGSVVTGSIPVTGWALDDSGVSSVKVYYRGSLVHLGDAKFVEGARPDIQGAYPDYPYNYRAGWSYTLLTNLLPDGGNGEFEIVVMAEDVEGNEVELGTTTIVCDNANAVKPFGDMDTPEPGGHASGTAYRNQGWVLTPPPNTIPQDGSTIQVYIDGDLVGNATYDGYREDIATLFPGYNNSEGALAYFDFDTESYENGLHTISWTVSDNGGNTTEGLGSRQFTVQNPPLETDVDDGEDVFIPTETNLVPVYPNPFNPQTRITYDLAESARVSMVIYDILGRRVLDLIDNQYLTPGRYAIDWQANDATGNPMPSGVYLLVMKAGAFVKTQKVILLR